MGPIDGWRQEEGRMKDYKDQETKIRNGSALSTQLMIKVNLHLTNLEMLGKQKTAAD